MSSPIFSVISSAIYKEYYKICYNSFWQNSKIPFEMIFVGNKPPTEFIGEHFKYIYSPVKIAQCIEIGARAAQGEYIIPIADDIIFSENFLNKLYQEILTIDTNHYLLSITELRSKKLGESPSPIENFKQENYHGVKFGECPCLSRKIWREIGGIDKRFISYCGIDLQLRYYELGFKFRASKDLYFREIDPQLSPEEEEKFNQNRVFRKYRSYQADLLDSFWFNLDGTVSNKRKFPVEPFDNENIREITQGEKGEWN